MFSGQPKCDPNWAKRHLLLAADTYKLHRHLQTDPSKAKGDLLEGAKYEDAQSLNGTLDGSMYAADETTLVSASFADLTQRSRSPTSASDTSSGNYKTGQKVLQGWDGGVLQNSWHKYCPPPPIPSDRFPDLPWMLQTQYCVIFFDAWKWRPCFMGARR